MAEERIRILHVLGRLDRGGAETMIMNLYRHIDRERIQFDFVIHTEETCDYTKEILALGGRIYSMLPFQTSTALGYQRRWRDFFRAHPVYTIVHGHMRSTASLYLHEAKRAGCLTIVHSHNTSSGRGFSALVKNILQFPLRYQADYLFACSRQAGIWLYGERACRRGNFRILKNGIETEAFRFDGGAREAKRRELLPEAERSGKWPVFLHIGRLETQKNHRFLLEIMKEIVKRCPDARLWLCGAGPLKEALQTQARAMGLKEQVRFLGVRTDVSALMQAADVMVFPSLFEGLPVTLVEAQAAGLPVLMSDTVTEEVILTDLVQSLPLSVPAAHWAQKACEMAAGSRETARADYVECVSRNGYDAAANAAALSRFYLQRQ